MQSWFVFNFRTGSSGVLSVTGQEGAVARWDKSLDTLRWFKLACNAATQNFSGLTATTHIRARVANAPCAATVSNAVTVVPWRLC